MIRGLAYLLASYKSNRVDNDSYVFFFKKGFEFWDWKSISANEFVSKTGFNDIELQVVITKKTLTHSRATRIQAFKSFGESVR